MTVVFITDFDYMYFPEPLGVKLSDASKKLGKKFATGASVVKVPLSWWSVMLLCLFEFELVEPDFSLLCSLGPDREGTD